MISFRNILLILTALVFAGGTAIYVKSWLESERSAFANNQQTEVAVVQTNSVEILVAAGDLPAGTFLSEDNLTWQPWPEEGVHENHIQRQVQEGDLRNTPISRLTGAVVRIGVKAGEPITAVRVVHPGERGFLAAVLEPGFRAISVPVDATTGISGFVFPGDWVDVMMTMQLRDEREGARQQRYFAQTVLEKVRILAIDQAVELEDGAPAVAKTATLEVSPKEAERVAVALEMGRLSLSLNSLSPDQSAAAHEQRLTVSSSPDSLSSIRNDKRSYTLDSDVYHMLGDRRLFPQKSEARRIHVVRGSEAEILAF